MAGNGSEYHRLLNSARWRATRAGVLERHPFCIDCRADGVLTPAAEVHHIIPVESARGNRIRMETLAFDPGNLATLCRSCHRERHRRLGSGGRAEARRRRKREAAAFWERVDAAEGGGFFNREGGPPYPTHNLFSRVKDAQSVGGQVEKLNVERLKNEQEE